MPEVRPALHFAPEHILDEGCFLARDSPVKIKTCAYVRMQQTGAGLLVFRG